MTCRSSWLNILHISIVFSLCSWITHCPRRLRPDKLEGSIVVDEDGVEADVGPGGVKADVGPGGVDNDVEAEVRPD